MIKSGNCRVIKNIIVDKQERDKYESTKYRRQLSYTKIESLNNYTGMQTFKTHQMSYNKRVDNYRRTENCLTNENDRTTVYLEIEKLKPGDIFGIHDLVLHADKCDLHPLTLVSDGVGCVLINKKCFLRYLSEEHREHLRNLLTAYPSKNSLVAKYFDSINWSSYRKCNLSQTFI